MTHKKINIISVTAAAVISIAGAGIFDRNTFTFPAAGDEHYALAMADYAVCRILAAFVLFAAFHLILTLIFLRNEKRDEALDIVKCGLYYLPVILAVMFIKLPQGFLSNDEYSIYEGAVILKHDTWFNFMTGYYYIVSLMLIPFKYAPIITKAVIEFFVVGYTAKRCRSYFGVKAGSFVYILFLLYPFIAYTTSAHRLPVYFLIYLSVFVKLLFDRLEKKEGSFAGVFPVLAAGAVLTQWRTEGIYLLVLIPILAFMAYPSLRNRKSAVYVIATYILIQCILWIPQNGMVSGNLDGAANDRMKPFWAYTITNMYRNGLDKTKNAEDLEIVDKYLSLDAIDAINEHYGDINYEDVLILYADGFVGVRENAGDKEFNDYSEALKRIFTNNPDVFIKTRWGAFCYAALPYHLTPLSDGMVSFAVNLVKSPAYNLFIPVTIVAALCIFSLFTKRWYTFFVSGGLIAHWFIVFILAPASYFKYYFPVYIMAYFYVIAMIIWYFAGRRKGLLSPID